MVLIIQIILEIKVEKEKNLKILVIEIYKLEKEVTLKLGIKKKDNLKN